MKINNDHKDSARRELITLCQQYIQLRPSTFAFFTGSSVEIPDSPMSQMQFDYAINAIHFDVDAMYNMTHIGAFSRTMKVPEAFVGEIWRICSDGVHPGYVKLISDKDGKRRDIHLDFINMSSERLYSEKHGPALQANILQMIQAVMTSKKALNPNLLNLLKCNLVDSVFSVHCPFWPDEAWGWVTRKRYTGFPPKCLIEEVVKYGCDLVKKSPPNHDLEVRVRNEEIVGENTFWRFSFSMAEFLIIKEWTNPQKIVYRTLRCLHKIILGKQGSSMLSTYHFKTAMLWECENRQQKSWNESSLKSLVLDMLYTIISNLERKHCPNYFIPENNMMDHLLDVDVREDVNILRYYITQDHIIEDVLHRSEYNEIFSLQAHCQIVLQSSTYRFLLLSQHILNSATRSNALHLSEARRTNDKKLLRALKKELYNIFFGLYFQRVSASCVTHEERNRHLIEAKRHLKAGTRLFESSETCFVDLSLNPELRAGFAWMSLFTQKIKQSSERHSPEYSLTKLHPEFRVRKVNRDSTSVDNKYAIEKTIVYKRDLESSVNIKTIENKNDAAKHLQSVDILVRIYSVFQENETLTTYYEGYVPNLPGFDATVSMSWFSAKAYLANFVYIIEHEYSTVIDICEEIQRVYHHSFMHAWFSDVCFPVFISTRWTSVYDNEIQILLGFYSLCSFILNLKESHEVHLAVCPVLFSTYLKLRCTMNQNNNINPLDCIQGCMNEIQAPENEWTNHLKQCTSDKNATNARMVLLTVLQFLGITIGGIPKP